MSLADELELSGEALSRLSAAVRHVTDARHLLEAGDHASPDQAFHLAGFGPECARKATLSLRAFDRALGHALGEAAEPTLSAVLAVDLVAHRYEIRGWQKQYPVLAVWSESVRYDATDRGGANPRAAAGVAEAEDIVRKIVFALWADGRVPEDFAW